MQYKLLLALLVVTTARGAVGSVLNGNGTTPEACLAGLYGRTINDKCQNFLDFASKKKCSKEGSDKVDVGKRVSKRTKSLILSKAKLTDHTSEDAGECTDSSDSSSSSCASDDWDCKYGFLFLKGKKVKQVKTLRQRLAKLEDRKCAGSLQEMNTPCSEKLAKVMPSRLAHFQKLVAIADKKCKA